MKKILLLGASGSVGRQTVDVIKEHPDELKLVGISVYENTEFLREMLQSFDLEYVYARKTDEDIIRDHPGVRFYQGEKGLEEIVREESYDLLVNAVVGFSGFIPTLKAIEAGKDIALANKETLIVGGDIIMKRVREKKVRLLPIDSEHSAILQCIQGHSTKRIRRLLITASGGSFRDKTREELKDVTLEDALKHPTWSMGNKITIDSATMMNKGFEIMEAHYLFGLPYDRIEPLIHKASIVHSMVEFEDGTVIAQLSEPDMRLPIKYSLLYPDNVYDSTVSYMDFTKPVDLTFEKVDYARYPLVKLAKEIGGFGGNFGAVLVGANDETVDLFLNGRIRFCEIEKYIIKTLKAAHFVREPSVEELVEYNRWAKEYVRNAWANNV